MSEVDFHNRVGVCQTCGVDIDPLLAPVLGILDDHVLSFCSDGCKKSFFEKIDGPEVLSPRSVESLHAPSTLSKDCLSHGSLQEARSFRPKVGMDRGVGGLDDRSDYRSDDKTGDGSDDRPDKFPKGNAPAVPAKAVQEGLFEDGALQTEGSVVENSRWWARGVSFPVLLLIVGLVLVAAGLMTFRFGGAAGGAGGDLHSDGLSRAERASDANEHGKREEGVNGLDIGEDVPVEVNEYDDEVEGEEGIGGEERGDGHTVQSPFSEAESDDIKSTNRLVGRPSLKKNINKEALGKKNFRFVIWPDTHVRTGKKGVAAPTSGMLRVVMNDIRPDFVIHTGDMIGIKQRRSKNHESNVTAMWDLFSRRIYFPLLRAGIPFFPTAGNHDIYNARKIYREYWRGRKNLGFKVEGPQGYAGYYSFRFGDAHFVSLVAPGTRSLPDRWNQVAWLAEDLKNARERGLAPIFVFSHSPLFCPKMDRRCSHDRRWLDDDELVELLGEHKVIYFGGHMHIYYDTVYRGIRSFITGMVGGGRKRLASRRTFQPYQFMVIDVKDKDFRIYRVKYPNLDTSHIPPKS